MREYLFIFMLFLVALGFVVFNFVLNALIGVKPKPTKLKQEPFECGMPVVHEANQKTFKVKYANVAIVFLLFDLETILLYPWAISARAFGTTALLIGSFFIFLLFFGLVYIWKKGLLNWN